MASRSTSIALFSELHVDRQTPGLSPKGQSPSLQLNRRWTRAALGPLCFPIPAAKTRRLTSVSGTLPIKARPTSLNLDSRDVPSPMTAFQTRDTATMSTTIEQCQALQLVAHDKSNILTALFALLVILKQSTYRPMLIMPTLRPGLSIHNLYIPTNDYSHQTSLPFQWRSH